jgi:flagellar hook-associated protein 2
MAGSLALSGLASGVDTNAIVQQLMAVEGQGKTRLTNKQSQSQAREAGLKDIQAKLAALRTAADALAADSTWKSAQTADSSDSARIAATILGGTAGAGSATLSVTTLAAAAQHAFEYTAPTAATEITVAGKAITLAAGTSITDAAAKINAAGTSVSATVVYDEVNKRDVLALAAKSTGVDSNFTVPELTAATNKRWERLGADAAYTVDGQPGTSTTNVIENAIPGVRLTLKATTPSPVTVTIGSPATDQTAAKAKIQAYVDAYNGLIDLVNAKTSEKTVPKATTTSDLTKGQLFGDTGLTSLMSRMRTMSSADDYTSAFDSWSDLGISTGKASGSTSDAAKLGKLQIDDAKLTDLLASNPDKVKTLLGKLSKDIDGFVDGQSKAITGRIASEDTQQKGLSDQMLRMDDQLKAKQDRLQAQFAAMETALSNAQSQQAWLQGQLAGLPSWG